ncbi:hypothetical protein [Actinomadura macrotermitis]|uniref:DUF4190 domain-containing protein n=1 Tax=Actinomadura macrotermitis TaxID=2585200 RepID=A0A7K0BUH5_9ACTN|nr:hypothetical protein [Actinomadura macrotermitis]MQY04839.1 hypothetical protein [Actinomadura macrotermitis]
MTMPGYRAYAPPAAPRRDGPAKASLALGVAGLLGLAFCLLGMLPALAGLVLGVLAVSRGTSAGRTAVAGIVCSALALLLGTMALYWLLSKAAGCADEGRYPDGDARARCVEREFPFARASAAR